MLRQDSSGVGTKEPMLSHPWAASSLAKPLITAVMQSPAAAGNIDHCIEQRLQLLVPRGFALLGRIGIARFPDFFDENLRGLPGFLPWLIAEGAHGKPIAVTIKKRPCRKQKKKFHVDPTCARNWTEPPPGKELSGVPVHKKD